ncbi:MAG: outer membrane lipoprotein carrier protein LolA [Planctomycetota bacterium]
MKASAGISGLVSCVLTIMLVASAASAGADREMTDEEMWGQVDQVTRTDVPVVTYRATFDQEKLSPLLREPIRSRGRVRIADGVSRWDTNPPNASTMTMREGELRIYYPQQYTLEIYELDNPKFRLAMSPTPDFTFLREHFTIKELHQSGEHRLEVVLDPADEDFAEAIEQVQVMVDRELGGMQMIAVTDVDGETTTLRFRDIELNPDIDPQDLVLAVPEGTKLVKPLDAMDN